MIINSALSNKIAENRDSINKMLSPLYAEADYLLATIASDEKEGIVVPSTDDRHFRVDFIMDEITRLINLI
ncbi:hypothetical protein D3C85_15840 [compost metagenome]